MANTANREFLYIGHRGLAGIYPENTLAAFRAAVSAGLAMVELDVRLSRDRRLMVIHDAGLDRVAGIPRQVREMTAAELAALDVGRWFDPAFRGEGVPTLAQVFEMVPSWMHINVEIKPGEHEASDPGDSIERQVLAVIDRFDARRRTLVSSFNPHILHRLRMLSEHHRLAVLSDADRQPDGIRLCDAIQADAWHPHHPLVNPAQVTRAHRRGLKVYTYTVNTKTECRRVKAAGADGLFSDNPAAIMC
ncbi:MAG: glycerophosphodiester phosphodiesterase family protein [Desulfosarcinaceae bacterium]|nr:glycerophosphodiester phosphodiesterase family protein [Desulfosarcinaceae bacterium]